MEIHANNIIEIKDGLSKYTIDAEHKICLQFNGNGKNASIFINLINANEVDLKISLKNGNYTILFWNQNNRDLTITESYEVLEAANLKIAFTDLNENNLYRDAEINLYSQGSKAVVKSSTMARSIKKINLKTTNYVPHTDIEMENYAIALKDSEYVLNATGAIVKNANGSRNIQHSNCLTYQKPKKTTIEPILLIDEYDVDAGHGCALGEIDEDILYYLQSRGLSKTDALRLISTGYLMPITEFIDDVELRDILVGNITSKIDTIC